MKKYLYVFALILFAFALGLLIGGGSEKPVERELHDHVATETSTKIWTCSMHPQIRMPAQGQWRRLIITGRHPFFKGCLATAGME